LLSDCPWPAEGNHVYSWMWIGPGVISRFCLGALPQAFRTIRVRFLDHEGHQNIWRNLAFQLNGRPVPHEARELGETGGVAQILLPTGLARPLVLGIGAFPDAAPNLHDGRHLRACIEALELTR